MKVASSTAAIFINRDKINIFNNLTLKYHCRRGSSVFVF